MPRAILRRCHVKDIVELDLNSMPMIRRRQERMASDLFMEKFAELVPTFRRWCTAIRPL